MKKALNYHQMAELNCKHRMTKHDSVLIDETIKRWGKTYCDNVRACLGNDEKRFRKHVSDCI